MVRGVASYGVGVDCHSEFIQVSIVLPIGGEEKFSRKEFETSIEGLTEADRWMVDGTKAVVPDGRAYHYNIESTGTYQPTTSTLIDAGGGCWLRLHRSTH
jgi:hypothetical protein